MTKFDVTTWFCKIVALAGLFVVGVWLLGQSLGRLFAFPGYVSDFSGSALTVAADLFIWFFAPRLGAAMSCENQNSTVTITSRDVNWLFLRCVGFWLCANGFVSGSTTVMRLGFFHYANSHVIQGYDAMMMPYLVVGLVQFLVGFMLAFGPRLNQKFRSS